jgi:hypothetical protein
VKGVILISAKKIITLGIVALVLFFIVTQPTLSAQLVSDLIGALKDGAEALIEFVRKLFSFS